jgi:WD40 repeat protein
MIFIPALLLLRSAAGTPASPWAALTGGKDAPAHAVDPISLPAAKGLRNLDSVWLSSSGEMLAVTSPGGTVGRAAFSPDGSLLATARDHDQGEHVDPMLQVSDQKAVAVLHGHTGEITALTFSPDGGWLASGGKDSTVRIWRLAPCQRQASSTGPR